jgi:hypothetical protein
MSNDRDSEKGVSREAGPGRGCLDHTRLLQEGISGSTCRPSTLLLESFLMPGLRQLIAVSILALFLAPEAVSLGIAAHLMLDDHHTGQSADSHQSSSNPVDHHAISDPADSHTHGIAPSPFHPAPRPAGIAVIPPLIADASPLRSADPSPPPLAAPTAPPRLLILVHCSLLI